MPTNCSRASDEGSATAHSSTRPGIASAIVRSTAECVPPMIPAPMSPIRRRSMPARFLNHEEHEEHEGIHPYAEVSQNIRTLRRLRVRTDSFVLFVLFVV